MLALADADALANANALSPGLPAVDPGVYTSDMRKMQTVTAKLLGQYVHIMRRHKSIMQRSYASIMDTNFKVREGEKERITRKLEKMLDDDRELDNIMKANKQGMWGKGLQKSHLKHVADDYDADREFADSMQEIERKVDAAHGDDVTDRNREQYMSDRLEEMATEMENEAEERDLSRVRGEDGEDAESDDEW